MNDAHGQSQYQVRFDWGTAGANAVGTDVDVIVVVDVLPRSSYAWSTSALPDGPAVLAGDLRNRDAVAAWVLEKQADKGGRLTVAVVALGEQGDGGGIRFAVEDQLAAGAIIAALADLGIDYCSPEAASAAASFTGLRNAIGHLVSASTSGRELTEAGEGERLRTAVRGAPTPVKVLREFARRS